MNSVYACSYIRKAGHAVGILERKIRTTPLKVEQFGGSNVHVQVAILNMACSLVVPQTEMCVVALSSPKMLAAKQVMDIVISS